MHKLFRSGAERVARVGRPVRCSALTRFKRKEPIQRMDTVATFLLREIDPEASESTAMGKLEFVAAGLCGREPEEVLLYSAGRFLHPMLTVSDLGLSAESEIETRGGGKSYHATIGPVEARARCHCGEGEGGCRH